MSLTLASLLLAFSADAATETQEAVRSVSPQLQAAPAQAQAAAQKVLQSSSVDQAVSSVVDVVRVRSLAGHKLGNTLL